MHAIIILNDAITNLNYFLIVFNAYFICTPSILELKKLFIKIYFNLFKLFELPPFIFDIKMGNFM